MTKYYRITSIDKNSGHGHTSYTDQLIGAIGTWEGEAGGGYGRFQPVVDIVNPCPFYFNGVHLRPAHWWEVVLYKLHRRING